MSRPGKMMMFPEQIVRAARAGVLPLDFTRAEVEAAYDAADRRMLDEAAARFRKEGGKWDAVRMDCFSKAEADRYRAYAEAKHPDVPWLFSWIGPPKEAP